MLATTLFLVFLLLSGAQMQQQQTQGLCKCLCHGIMSYILVILYVESINRERIESLQKEVASLKKELNYWQNTTINILKKYLLENDGIIIEHQ